MRNTHLPVLAAVAAVILCLTSCGGGKSSAKVYEIGNRVEAGHLIYTVLETQWLPQLGTGDAARVPKNRFFLIRLSAVNSGSEELMVPNFILKDDQGNTLEELSNGDGVPQWVGYLRKVKPADSLTGNVVFDAQPKHYSMHVTDENGEQPAIIDIPLNFTSETPQIPTPVSAPPDFTAPTKK